MVLFTSPQGLFDKSIDLIGSSNLTDNLALDEQDCQDDFAFRISFLDFLTKQPEGHKWQGNTLIGLCQAETSASR
jgi:hypothetical protein